MHVIESALGVTKRGIRRLKINTFEDRVLTVRLTNGTRETLRTIGKLEAAGSCDVSFASLEPGQAGTVRFWSSSGTWLANTRSGCHHAGAVELGLGDERLFISESCPIGQSVSKVNRFAMGFASEGARTLPDFYNRTPQEFMGTIGARDRTQGQGVVARVVAVSGEPPSCEVDVVLLDDEVGEVEYELDSNQQLEFMGWCVQHHADSLGCVLFLAELGAVMPTLGIPKLPLTDKAFVLDILVCTFVTSGVLCISAEALEMNLKHWQGAGDEALSKARHAGASGRPDYASYSVLASDPAVLDDTIDAARLLLRAAAVQCARKLQDVVTHCRVSGAWPAVNGFDCFCRAHSGRNGASEEPRRHGDLATSTLMEHLHYAQSSQGTAVTSECSESSISSAALANGGEQLLRELVRRCIHASACACIQRTASFSSLVSQLSSRKAREAVQHYQRWSLLAERRFCVMTGEGAASPRIAFHAFDMEVLDQLDGGDNNAEQLLLSLGNSAPPYRSMKTNSKSGELFMFSSDHRFIVKTISSKECSLLRRLMPAYKHHIRCWPRSLIVRFGGLFCVDVPGGRTWHFVVMRSVFDPGIRLHETYDLKGSSYNRRKKAGESVSKDQDWISPRILGDPGQPDSSHAGQPLRLPDTMRREIAAQHELDVTLLSRFKIMDYSILLGIHNRKEGDKDKGSDKLTDAEVKPSKGPRWRCGQGIYASDSSAIYFLGIIDFSIKYSTKKQAENLLLTAWGKGDLASCVPQENYAIRQAKFFRKELLGLDPEDPEVKDLGTLGRLRIHLRAGFNLIAADWIGTSDPYVRATLGMLTVKTPIMKRTCNPKWDCVMFLPVNEAHRFQSLELAVYDSDNTPALRGQDDFLGSFVISMQQLLHESLDEPRVDLTGVSRGQLSVAISFETLAVNEQEDDAVPGPEGQGGSPRASPEASDDADSDEQPEVLDEREPGIFLAGLRASREFGQDLATRLGGMLAPLTRGPVGT